MAGNEWINGYLEAILDSGAGAAAIDEQKAAPMDRGHFNPTRYFVEEVVTGVDETDLHRTWIKVVATRNTRERSSRLENMCWRIWHLTRKKKQFESEELQRLAKRRWEREQGRRDVTEDMSEDLSEGERGDALAELMQPETPRKKFQRNFSNLEVWSDDKKEKKLYIVLISLHGLVRGENMELGRDSDTGGQVKYVVELSRALARMPGVYRVDLFTRQVSSPEVDWSYGEPAEMLTGGPEDEGIEMGESSGAYIIRIPFGPRDNYLRKELLWPYIQEFVDGALAHILNMSKVLGEQIGGDQPVWPYVIHGHYADAGDSAALLSGALNVPMVLTGHSLGRNKLEQLLKQGRQSKKEINSTYKIMRRIEAEELSLDAAELVITSTRQEIDEQWGLYDGFDVKLEKVLRARSRRGVNCHGRFMPRMVVIPPGMDFSNVVVQEDTLDVDELATLIGSTDGSSPKAIPAIWSDVMRFLTNPHKPMILALSRPDPKKNITTLLKAFGECRPLRELSNLTLIMGNRDDIDEMSGGNASVLTTVLKMIDKYDLYGQVAYPKHHKQSDVPDIYRLAAKTKGVFINPALVEPFGLTLIEAAAHGLPMVATQNGGPVDIHRALNNGLLVDPHNQNAIADALLTLVSEKNLWHECRKNGWKNIHLYSWPEHCRTYLTRVAACRMRHPQWQNDTPGDDMVSQDSSLNDSLKDVQDMSLRLSVDGDKSSLTGSLDYSAAAGGDVQDQVKRVLSKIKKPESDTKDNKEVGKKPESDSKNNKEVGKKPDPVSKDNKEVGKKPESVSKDDKEAGKKPESFSKDNKEVGKKPDSVSKDNKEVGKKPESDSKDNKEVGKKVVDNAVSKYPMLRRRRRLIVIALDYYDSRGAPEKRMVQIVQDIFTAVLSDTQNARVSGFALSTAMPMSETVEFLNSAKIQVNEFDALICSSGGEIYYPGTYTEEDGRLFPDPDYESHIDYRWGCDGLKKTISKMMNTTEGGERSGNTSSPIEADEKSSNAHCISYLIKDLSKVNRIEDLRQKLRMRGLRCHPMYCRNSTRIQIVPLLASRAQALRYLFVRWKLNVANMFVFLGETGDTDYEELIYGAHKTLILKGLVQKGSEELLRTTDLREDMFPSESPLMVHINANAKVDDIANALKQVTKNSAGM